MEPKKDFHSENFPHELVIPEFSFFKAPITNTIPWCTVSLPFVYDLVRSSTYFEVTEKLREISEPAKARVFKKENFDFVCFSGIFSRRDAKHMVRPSSLLVLDYDHIPGDKLQALKRNLIENPAPQSAMVFTSPGGAGVKWLVEVDLSLASLEIFFKSISRYSLDKFGLLPDPSGKDPGRACFLPWDPNVFINPKYLRDE